MKPGALLALAASAAALPDDCPAYVDYSAEPHGPYSSGVYELPSQRPSEECRTYRVPAVEELIEGDLKNAIGDPDLYQLFRNAWPNTIDTTVLWRGAAEDNAAEELSFIITGDINAMWLRDSANQLQSYKSLLRSSSNTTVEDIATLYRGAINLQSRYIRKNPYCNAFQPPAESGIAPVKQSSKRGISARDTVTPPYDPEVVFECKYELDSIAAFLQLSWDYFEETRDADFFGKFAWKDTVRTIMDTASDMSKGTYAEDGSINESPYTWERDSTRSTETVSNNGNGEPVKGGIGLVRSFFRPSDDSTIYQYLIPSNMMFARYLKACAIIMKSIDGDMAKEMKKMAAGVEKGISEYATVKHPEFGQVYAYEVDGFGSFNIMDDANLPSLLSIPHLGFEAKRSVYENTRKLVLSKSNRYYAYGPVINATGGPHLGPGRGWPMGVVMQILTSDDDDEIIGGLKQLLGSTSGLGLIHESVNSHDDSVWTRSWFAWANGLFGQMILDLANRKPHILSKGYQG